MRIRQSIGGASDGLPWSGEDASDIRIIPVSFIDGLPKIATIQVMSRKLPQPSTVLLFQASPFLRASLVTIERASS